MADKLTFNQLPDKDELLGVLSERLDVKSVTYGWGTINSLLVVRHNGRAVRIRFTRNNEIKFGSEVSSQGKMLLSVLIPIVGLFVFADTFLNKENKEYAQGLGILIESLFDQNGQLIEHKAAEQTPAEEKAVEQSSSEEAPLVSLFVSTEDEDFRIEGYKGQSFTTSIGCSDSADIFIADPVLEEEHAVITFNGEQWLITDKSTNQDIKYRQAGTDMPWKSVPEHKNLRFDGNIDISLSGCLLKFEV